MAEFRRRQGEIIVAEVRAFHLEPLDHYTPTADERKFRRRVHGFQQQLMRLAGSDENLRNDKNWTTVLHECIARLGQTADDFISDLISAEDAFLMTYVHQGHFEALVATAATTGGGRTQAGTRPGQRQTPCNLPQCPRRLVPTSPGS